MAFNLVNFQFARGVDSSYAQGQGITMIMHTYISKVDTIATITTAGYFPANIDGALPNDKTFVGDQIMITGSDSTALVNILTLDPTVTVGINLLAAGANLTVGASVNATDNNGIIIAGDVLTAENANAFFGGLVTNGAQSIAGLKNFTSGIGAFGTGVTTSSIDTSSGALTIGSTHATAVNIVPTLNATGGIASDLIQGTGAVANVDAFNNIAGNPTSVTIGSAHVQVRVGAAGMYFTNYGGVLSQFNTISQPVTWVGPFSANQSGTIYLTIINNMVYMTIRGIPNAAQSHAQPITNSAPGIIPVGYLPAVLPVVGTIRVFDNGNYNVGVIQVAGADTVSIASGINANVFAGAGSAGFNDVTMSWSIV